MSNIWTRRTLLQSAGTAAFAGVVGKLLRETFHLGLLGGCSSFGLAQLVPGFTKAGIELFRDGCGSLACGDKTRKSGNRNIQLLTDAIQHLLVGLILPDLRPSHEHIERLSHPGRQQRIVRDARWRFLIVPHPLGEKIIDFLARHR